MRLRWRAVLPCSLGVTFFCVVYVFTESVDDDDEIIIVLAEELGAMQL